MILQQQHNIGKPLADQSLSFCFRQCHYRDDASTQNQRFFPILKLGIYVIIIYSLFSKKKSHHFYHVDFIKRCGSGKRRSCLVDAVIYLHLHALITKSWTPDTLELLPHKKILTRNKRASPNHKWYLGQIRRLDDDSR